MLESYKILWQGGTGELTEKKSRFIARTSPAESEEEAAAFIESVRRQYWDARHHCFAYVCGDRNQIQRYSDDGEPGQTAGRPILDVILGSGVHNICVVVTRYFGGTLLGTGGLVRAYSGAAKEGLKGSVIVEKCPGRLMKIAADYTDIGKKFSIFWEKIGSLYWIPSIRTGWKSAPWCPGTWRSRRRRRSPREPEDGQS